MKKSILSVLLMFALVVPVLASQAGGMEVVGKIGANLNLSLKAESGGNSETYDTDMSVMLAAEGFYCISPAVALGLGVSNNFDTKIKDTPIDAKIGFTNVYFALKPKIALESDFFDSIYFLAQAGYGFARITEVKDVENGMYWGVGAGTEMQSFIFEVLYSCNYSKFQTSPTDKSDGTFSTIALNVGYKFAL